MTSVFKPIPYTHTLPLNCVLKSTHCVSGHPILCSRASHPSGLNVMSLVRSTSPLSASEHIWIYLGCKDGEGGETNTFADDNETQIILGMMLINDR